MSGYLDAASAAPLSPAARQALLAALDDGWADPSRLYGQARRAALLLDGARPDWLDRQPDRYLDNPCGRAQSR